jgi:hypothetical protein
LSQSVAKHRYWKGKNAAKSVGNYTKYVQFRQGPDREKGGRKFFDEKDDESQKDFAKLLKEMKARGAVAHELILSPGVNQVDQLAYTRELMDKLGQSKGQELEWVAVAHSNTKHNHIHVLILGESKDHKPVNIGRTEHGKLREWGDKYIDREHFLDKFLDREIDEVIDRGYQMDRGDALFNSLVFGIKHGKEEEKARPAKESNKGAEKDTSVKDGEKDSGKEPDKVDEKEEPKAQQKRVWDKGRAIAELPEEDKIVTGSGEVFTKFSAKEDLQAYADKLKVGSEQRLEKDDYKKLWSWIGTKEKAGDDFYERQEREKFESDEPGKKNKKDKKAKTPERESAPSFREERQSSYSKSSRRHESRVGYLEYRRKPRAQRNFETMGRNLEEHSYYEIDKERARLNDLKNRLPDKREILEKQLEDLDRYKADIDRDFKDTALEELLGWKKSDSEKEKDKKEGDDKDKDKDRTDSEETASVEATQQEEAAKASEELMRQQTEQQMSQIDEANQQQHQNREKEVEGSREQEEPDWGEYGR